jgi:squalene synthase HpnC
MATARANVQSGPLYAASNVPTAAPPPGTFDVASAYAFCARLAKSHYENFTIASWLMPREMRPHMHAIYAYARMADDFADEHHDLAMLDAWERELDSAYAGAPRHPVFIALADTVRKFDIPREPFLDLLAAFRSAVDFKGFDTLDELLGYSRNSANPVGRLVLYLFGYRDAARQHLSDLICSGLQLANFWQDVAVDLDKRRIYFPRRDMQHFGVDAAMLAALKSGADCGERFVELMRHEVGVARAMLLEGGELRNQVDARLRRDIAMFAGGGLAILRAIERIDYDVFRKRQELTKLDYLSLGWNAIRGRLES